MPKKPPEFICKRDGFCCQFVGVAYPFMTDDGMRCRQLQGDNECLIYETRPWICDYKKVMAKHDDPDRFAAVQHEVCRLVRKLKKPTVKKMRKILARVKDSVATEDVLILQEFEEHVAPIEAARKKAEALGAVSLGPPKSS